MTEELETKLNLYLANQMVDYVKKHNLNWMTAQNQRNRRFMNLFLTRNIGLEIPKKSWNLPKKRATMLLQICSTAIPKTIKNWHGC